MAQTQLADVIVPASFSAYQTENSLISTALFQSGVLVPNALMATHLANGSNNFVIPFWSDASELEADITSDDPTKMFPARAALGELVPGVLAIGGVADKDGDYSFGH